MASSGAVSLDTVMIEIESNAGHATSNIDSLATNLQKLKDSVKGGYNNLNKLATSISNLKSSSKGLTSAVNNLSRLDSVVDNLSSLSQIKAPSGLNATIKRLNELSIASQDLYNTSKNVSFIQNMITPLQALKTIETPKGLNAITRDLESLSKVTNVDTIVSEMSKLPQIIAPLSSLSEIVNPKGMTKAIANLKEIPSIMSKFDASTLENLKRVSTELAASLQPLSDQLGKIADGYSAVSKMSDTYGVSAKTVTRYSKQQVSIWRMIKAGLSGVNSIYKKLKGSSDNFAKTANKNFDKLNSKIKQIGLSLLGTRTLFTMIRKAVSEYQAFDEELQKFSQNVWRAFGAQLAPVIYLVMDLFKQFVRVIYSVVLALTGIDLIARANEKAMAGWGKAAKDTLGNLQKFDDLNVVEFPKNASGDDNSLIELDKIDLSPIQKVIDWVKRLRDEIKAALDTGRWYNVGKVFGDGINEGVEFLLNRLPDIRNKLFEVARNFGDFLNGVIENTNWENVGELLVNALKTKYDLFTSFLKSLNWTAIGEGITNFLKGYDFSKVIASKLNLVGTIVDSFQEAIYKIDFKLLGKRLGETIVTGLVGIGKIISKIDFKELGTSIRETLENIPWKDIWDGIVKIAEEAFKGLGDFLEGLLGIDNVDWGSIALGIGAIAASLLLFNKFKSKDLSKNLKNTGTSFTGFFDSLGKSVEIIAILGGLALVLQSLANVLDSFANTGLSAGDGLLLLGGALGAIAIGFTAIAAASKLLDIASTIEIIGVMASMALVLESVTRLFNVFAKTNLSVGDGLLLLGGLLTEVVIAMGAMAGVALLLGSNPLALIAVAALVAAISAVLLVLKETIPTILESCAKFINNIAPFVIQLLTTIGDIIERIIRALGETLPPIIDSVGKMFTRIFSGVGNIIKSVGDVIVNVMKTAQNLIVTVLREILNFINELGPAINTFVDNVIEAITKLINFVVSGVEYLINTAIVKPINSLINSVNENAIAEKLGWQLDKLSKVEVDRFRPQLETGTNEIPYEGLYHLHPGEAVVPKKYNPALGNGGSDEMNNKLDTLIEIMDNMNFTNVVNVGNKKLYEGQQSFNKRQQNKYGTINLY